MFRRLEKLTTPVNPTMHPHPASGQQPDLQDLQLLLSPLPMPSFCILRSSPQASIFGHIICMCRVRSRQILEMCLSARSPSRSKYRPIPMSRSGSCSTMSKIYLDTIRTLWVRRLLVRSTRRLPSAASRLVLMELWTPNESTREKHQREPRGKEEAPEDRHGRILKPIYWPHLRQRRSRCHSLI